MAEQQNTPEFINDPTGHDEDVEDAVPFGRPQDSTATLEHNSVTKMEHNSVPVVEHNVQPNFDYFESSKKLLKSIPGAEYNMRHERRGLALIFNQYKFEKKNPTEESSKERKKEKKLPGDKLKERKKKKEEDKRFGTELDSSAFKEQLKRLGFDVQQHVDYTRAEILDELEELAEEDHSQSDCILIAIFSHGYYNGEILAHDMTSFNLNEILEKFTDENCPTLKGKPKLFFLQVCQGAGEDIGGKIKEKEEEKKMRKEGTKELLQHPDFLIAHPSAHGLVSYRRPGYGSWFIQKLCQELAKNGTNLDLITILTYVSQYVARLETTGNEAKQVPCITSMLTRIVRFDDKKKHQPGTSH